MSNKSIAINTISEQELKIGLDGELVIRNSDSWTVNGSGGNAGDVLTNQGTGSSPTWEPIPIPYLQSTQIAFGSSLNEMTSSSKLCWLDGSSQLVLTGTSGTIKIKAADVVDSGGDDFNFEGSNSSSGLGGDLVFSSGSGTTGSGNLVFNATNSPSGSAGNFQMNAGDSNSGTAGTFTLVGGEGLNVDGGDMFLVGGASSNANGGDINITGGQSNNADGGNVVVHSGSGDLNNGSIEISTGGAFPQAAKDVGILAAGLLNLYTILGLTIYDGATFGSNGDVLTSNGTTASWQPNLGLTKNVISTPTTIPADTSYVVVGYLTLASTFTVVGNVQVL